MPTWCSLLSPTFCVYDALGSLCLSPVRFSSLPFGVVKQYTLATRGWIWRAVMLSSGDDADSFFFSFLPLLCRLTYDVRNNDAGGMLPRVPTVIGSFRRKFPRSRQLPMTEVFARFFSFFPKGRTAYRFDQNPLANMPSLYAIIPPPHPAYNSF